MGHESNVTSARIESTAKTNGQLLVKSDMVDNWPGGVWRVAPTQQHAQHDQAQTGADRGTDK
jgi:hypothetical protein